uniref:Ribonuclease T2-like 1-A n=1 Tax=Lygus hesperus TaxID=30085 RepID=A0A0A9XII6_LYGHE
MGLAFAKKRYFWNLKASFEIKSRDDWNIQQIPIDTLNTINCFTDGSKIDRPQEATSGAGVYIPSLGVADSYSLDEYATVFQTEMFALHKCLTTLIGRGISNMKINS